jgi:hypothetical protein
MADVSRASVPEPLQRAVLATPYEPVAATRSTDPYRAEVEPRIGTSSSGHSPDRRQLLSPPRNDDRP